MILWTTVPHPPFLCCLSNRTCVMVIALSGILLSGFAGITRHYGITNFDSVYSFDLVFSTDGGNATAINGTDTFSNPRMPAVHKVLTAAKPYYVAAAPSYCWAIFLSYVLLLKGVWFMERCNVTIWLVVKAFTLAFNLFGTTALFLCYEITSYVSLGLMVGSLLVQAYTFWIVLDFLFMLNMIKNLNTEQLISLVQK